MDVEDENSHDLEESADEVDTVDESSEDSHLSTEVYLFNLPINTIRIIHSVSTLFL